MRNYTRARPFTAPQTGVNDLFVQKAKKVLHHRVFRDKGHKPWVGKMVVLQLEHMQ